MMAELTEQQREALVGRLTAYVKAEAHTVSDTDQEFIGNCLAEAVALVDQRCGAALGNVPEAALHRAYIEAGSELYNRRAAPNGISQFAAADGSAIRVARDPMVAANPILAPFLPLGIA